MAKTTMPEWLEPMAATLTQERFTGDDWLFERKFDGIRLFHTRASCLHFYSNAIRHLMEVSKAGWLSFQQN